MVAGLLLNARLLPFGFAVADVLGQRSAARLAGAHLVTDETVAFALAAGRPGAPAGGVLGLRPGALRGAGTSRSSRVRRSARWSRTPTPSGSTRPSPPCCWRWCSPSLRTPSPRVAALVGAVLAVAATPYVPAGLPVLLSLLGVVVTLGRKTGAAR